MDEYPLTPLSVEQCKDLLRTVARMICVKSELISARLLSDLDKDNMLLGLISIESLIVFVEVWRDNGMPDYAHGKFESYADERLRENKGKLVKVEKNGEAVYRKPFVEYRNDE